MMGMMFIIVYSMSLSALLIANEDIVLEAKVEKTECMFMFRQQNVEHIQNIKTDHKSLEIVAKFKYVGTTLRNQNCTHLEIKAR
jgi:uncharacterized protein (DUF488 family)